MEGIKTSRRQWLGMSGLVLASLVNGSAASVAEEQSSEQGEVSAPEDLVREHGVLRRVLLIYRHLLLKRHDGAMLQWGKADECTSIIRSFVEDYHERLEEQYVFPYAMYSAGRSADLVNVFIEQHQAGRGMTDTITRIARRQGSEPTDAELLATALDQFVTTYEPHVAREDTVIFLGSTMSGKAASLSGWERSSKKRRIAYSGRGFEKMVDRVASIERDLGIYDLQRFTPTV